MSFTPLYHEKIPFVKLLGISPKQSPSHYWNQSSSSKSNAFREKYLLSLLLIIAIIIIIIMIVSLFIFIKLKRSSIKSCTIIKTNFPAEQRSVQIHLGHYPNRLFVCTSLPLIFSDLCQWSIT